MRVIGLTGGIASGKSTVSAWLRQWGAHIVDTDAISHETTKIGGKGYAAVAAHFGPEILKPDGELDRRKLGGIVFADEGKRREQEQLRRVMARDGLTAQQAQARIDSQMPLSEKLARADRTIDNSGSRERTQELLRALWEELA